MNGLGGVRFGRFLIFPEDGIFADDIIWFDDVGRDIGRRDNRVFAFD